MGICTSHKANTALNSTVRKLDWLEQHFRYIDSAPVGEGQYGRVFKAKTLNGETVALKVISKKGLDEEELAHLATEVAILKQLDHPGVLRLVGKTENQEHFVIVTEFCNGTDLFELIVKQHEREPQFTE